MRSILPSQVATAFPDHVPPGVESKYEHWTSYRRMSYRRRGSLLEPKILKRQDYLIE